MYLGGTIMAIIKEMCVVENVNTSGFMSYSQQSVPSKIVGWILENTICKNDHNLPIVNIGPMLIGTVMPIVAGYDINNITTEKREIPILVPSLAVKQDDGTWNLYSNVVIMFEVKYDKCVEGIENVVARTFNMKIMSQSNDIKTGLNLFDLFSVFDV